MESRSEKLLLTWEEKVELYYSGRGIRLPSSLHEFEKEIAFFPETKFILDNPDLFESISKKIGVRLKKPPVVNKASYDFYGFLYCVINKVCYQDLLKKQKAHPADLNSIVSDVLIDKKETFRRLNFKGFKRSERGQPEDCGLDNC